MKSATFLTKKRALTALMIAIGTVSGLVSHFYNLYEFGPDK